MVQPLSDWRHTFSLAEASQRQTGKCHIPLAVEMLLATRLRLMPMKGFPAVEMSRQSLAE